MSPSAAESKNSAYQLLIALHTLETGHRDGRRPSTDSEPRFAALTSLCEVNAEICPIATGRSGQLQGRRSRGLLPAQTVLPLLRKPNSSARRARSRMARLRSPRPSSSRQISRISEQWHRRQRHPNAWLQRPGERKAISKSCTLQKTPCCRESE